MRIDYKKKVLLSQEEKDSQDVQFAIQESKLELASAILATEKSLANAKKALEEVKTMYPLNCQAIVDATCNVDNLQKGLDILRSTQKELGLE